MARTLLLALLLVVVSAAYVAIQAGRLHHAEDAASKAADRAMALEAELQEARASERVVIRYVDRVQVVRERANTITKEVPAHVTAEADARCPVPAGFVRVHDAAARNLPAGEPPGDPDAPAAGVTLSGVAVTVGRNYGTCHEIREQLIALQAYVASLQGDCLP